MTSDYKMRICCSTRRLDKSAIARAGYVGGAIPVAGLVACFALVLFFVTGASAQEQAGKIMEEVTVTGSRIKGASETGILPASVLSSEVLDSFGAESTGDLLGNLAQAGAFEFSESSDGPNDARGDVATVNLRGLGSGNTLVLLNGRRLVLHPFTQDIDRTPRAVVNVNTIPSQAIERTEILKDGASALYGADATAGVVNAVIKDDFEGHRISYRKSAAESIGLDSDSISYSGGYDFNEGRTHINTFASFYRKSGIFAYERRYSASVDLRPLLPPDWVYADGPDTDFRNLDRISDYGQFRVGELQGAEFITANNAAITEPLNLTSISGIFHIQPTGTVDPSASLPYGVDLDRAPLDTELRYNTNARRQLSPAVKRGNVFISLDHELDVGLTLFGELAYYYSDSHSQRATQPIDQGLAFQIIPADNYWNPFGPTLLGGVPNVNRLPDLGSSLPDGSEILIDRWRPTDIGPRVFDTRENTYRILGGVKGYWGNWDWESALFYNRAEAKDKTANLISKTALQQQLALSTPDAINPFGGPGANSVEQMDRIRISIVNKADTELTSWDLRASHSDLFSMPWADDDAGVAAGIEWRNEQYADDRDNKLDGKDRFLGGVEGGTGNDISDVAGISPTADSKGTRNVYSLYGELLVPLVSGKPLIQRIDFQLALRFEALDDINEEILKPKYALAWRPHDFVTFRTSYSEGFRAPNLVQLFRGDISRLDRDLVDWWRVAVNATDSSQNSYRRVVRESNTELESEDSESFVYGLQVDFPVFDGGQLLFSVDRWKFDQENVIETLGGAEQLALDYLLRQQGSSNPLVVRDAPTAEDILLYNSSPGFTAADAAGRVLYIRDPYVNLDPRTVEGIDFAVRLDLPESQYGLFAIQFEASKLLKFDQPNDEVAAIFSDPLIQSALASDSAGDLKAFSVSRIELDDKPKWRSSGSLNWRLREWGAAWSYTYIGKMFDTDAVNDITGKFWEIESWFVQNLHVDYRFGLGAQRFRVRVGVTNLEDKDPPLVEDARGYYTSFHNNRGRQWSLSMRADL
ncbi:MAG: TonB-dependent receptor [Pseudomonadales bacterium]